MQGKKQHQEKLFNQFQLSVRVPEHNFYRRLKGVFRNKEPDKKERIPSLKESLCGLPHTQRVPGQECPGKEVYAHLLPGPVERNIARINSPQGRYMKIKRKVR